MRIDIRYGRKQQGLGWAYVALITVAAAFIRMRPGYAQLVPICPWRAITGLPCPFCGGTHAFAALVHGQIALAWKTNPFVVFLVAVVYIWGVFDLLTFLMKRSLALEFGRGERKWAAYLAGLILFANWVYLVFTSRI